MLSRMGKETDIEDMTKTKTKKTKKADRFCSTCGKFKPDSEWTGRDRRTRQLEGAAALCNPCRLQAWRDGRWVPNE